MSQPQPDQPIHPAVGAFCILFLLVYIFTLLQWFSGHERSFSTRVDAGPEVGLPDGDGCGAAKEARASGK